MRINPESLARASSRHPWRTLVICWVVLIAADRHDRRRAVGRRPERRHRVHEPARVHPRAARDRRTSSPSVGRIATPSRHRVVATSRRSTTRRSRSTSSELQAALAARTDLVAESPASYYDVVREVRRAPPPASCPVRTGRRRSSTSRSRDSTRSKPSRGFATSVAEHRPDGFETQVAGQATLFDRVQRRSRKRTSAKGESIGIAIALDRLGGRVRRVRGRPRSRRRWRSPRSLTLVGSSR